MLSHHGRALQPSACCDVQPSPTGCPGRAHHGECSTASCSTYDGKSLEGGPAPGAGLAWARGCHPHGDAERVVCRADPRGRGVSARGDPLLAKPLCLTVPQMLRVMHIHCHNAAASVLVPQLDDRPPTESFASVCTSSCHGNHVQSQ